MAVLGVSNRGEVWQEEEVTLNDYRNVCLVIFGEDSPQVHFINEKIEQSPRKENEEVLADERQMLILLASLSQQPTRGAQ